MKNRTVFFNEMYFVLRKKYIMYTILNVLFLNSVYIVMRLVVYFNVYIIMPTVNLIL